MRNLKQMTAIGLSILSIAQCFSPVFAEGEVTNTISEAGSLSSDVTYTQDSSFTVSIPKKIILDSNKSAAYHVNVTGDIYGDQTITVTPDAEVTLTDKNGKGAVTATVSQNDTVFEYADIKAVDESGTTVGKTVEGSITAEDLTAGKWEGTLNFKIGDTAALQAGLYDANGVMLCSWEDSGIDVETDKDCESEEADSAHYVLTNRYPTTTKVIIPNGVTSIASETFCSCNGLKNIIIPNSVTSIGYYAFDHCTSLTSITIPSSVTSIGDYAFNGCSNLTSINVDSNNSSYSSSNGILFNKNKTTLIRCPEGKSGSITIPNSVTSIEDSAFYKCSDLTSITISSSVTSIENITFGSCSSLTSITIPSSVTSIGQNAFANCSNLTNATFENPTGWYVGDSAGAKTTAISSSDLSNKSTAATYLRSTYRIKYWTR